MEQDVHSLFDADTPALLRDFASTLARQSRERLGAIGEGPQKRQAIANEQHRHAEAIQRLLSWWESSQKNPVNAVWLEEAISE
jgi:hypothetical protein